jgi:hypothetical protein
MSSASASPAYLSSAVKFANVHAFATAFDLAQARSCRQAHILAGNDLCLVDSQSPGFIQRQRDEFFEFGATERFAFCDCSHDYQESLIECRSVGEAHGRLLPPDRGPRSAW